MSKIPRYKAPEDYSVAEITARKAAEARGETFAVENPEYAQARAVALDAAGLEAEGDATPLEAMSAEQHATRMQRPAKW